ncbi:MAG TPA: hypothetical protein VFU47_10175, partial [Armatimonadota bacterium]|nr:hypothetical protein [Armatimonadota bacterium]
MPGPRRLILRTAALGAAMIAACCAAGRRGAAQAAEPTVTLALDRAPLTQVAAELTRQSGIPHRIAGREGRSQLVVLFCREQPVSRVRQALAGLLGWTWSRGERDGKPAYTLLKGLALQKQEAELRARFLAE